MFTDLKIHSKYCRIRQGEKEQNLGSVRDKIAVFIYFSMVKWCGSRYSKTYFFKNR
jgi:hypothetical protein